MTPKEYGYWIGFRRVDDACVPEGWRMERLRDVAQLRAGGSLGLTLSDYLPEGVDAYSAEGLNGKTAAKEFTGPAVIVSSIGARCGKCFFVAGDFTTLANVQVIFPNPEKLNAKFLWNVINRETFWDRYATAQPFIRPSEIKKSWIPIPPPDEQAAIAGVLDAVDKAIDRSRKAHQSALKLRVALVADLLAVGVGEDGKVRALDNRHSAFSRTAIGCLPAAWRVSNVGAEFDIQSGITLNEAQRSNQRLWRYLRVANVQREALLLDDVQTLRAREPEVSLRLLQAGDLLVVEGHADRRQIGRCAMATDDAAGMTFQNHLFRLRPRGDMLPEFGCLWLNSWHAQKYWNAMCATSSGLNTINQRMLRRLSVAVPPRPEQERIIAVAESSKSHISELGRRLAALERLKKSLLHDLLTGAVRVNPALFPSEAAA
jgi:type I restriction enzyme S subunit